MKLDGYSKEGAERLARKIVRYWRKRGAAVSAWVVKFGNTGEPIYLVKSDLHNGLPAQMSGQAAIAA